MLLLWCRPESSGQAGADPGGATEASDLYQNEEVETGDIIGRHPERPCRNVRLSGPAGASLEPTQSRDAEDAEAAENDPEEARSAATRTHSQRSPLH